MRRNRERAPGRRAGAGQSEYANAEDTEYNVNFYVPSLIQLCFLSLKVFEEQLVLSLDEDEDDGDIIDYSSVSGESFPSICQRASIMLHLSWGLMPVE